FQLSSIGLLRLPCAKPVSFKLPLIHACQCGHRSSGLVMRQLIFLAVGLVVAGSYAAGFADRAVETRPEPQAVILEPANDLRKPTASGRMLLLESARQGFFQARGAG